MRPTALAGLAALAVLALGGQSCGAGVLYESDFSQFAGAGVAPGGSGGTLDSARWSIAGLSDGDSAPGDTRLSGDFARGLSSGGTGTGGLYAFVIPGSAGGRAPGVQPTGGDMTPGALVLTLENSLATTLAALTVSFDVVVRNDGARSTSVAFDLGLEGAWTALPALSLETPGAADPAPTWVATPLAASVGTIAATTGPAITAGGLAIAPGAALGLRWRLEDAGGSGGRDEIALDRIRVLGTPPAATPVTESGTLALFGAGLAFVALGRRGPLRSRRALRTPRRKALRIVNPAEIRG